MNKIFDNKQFVEAIICQSRFSVIGTAHGKFFGIAARIDPRLA